MDEKLLRKLSAEESISAEEALRLDASLESADQLKVRSIVESATSDSIPSLTWRSELNEKLSLVSGRDRRSRVLRFSSVGAVAAAVVALAFLYGSPRVDSPIGPGPTIVKEPIVASLEDVLLQDQQYAMEDASMDIHAPIDGASLDY
ncbi:MAG: hypothetical protein IH944_11290 [Armatimonadetes bacterium]|nr:hypothetical protein [Armatimonadota bacterium]